MNPNGTAPDGYPPHASSSPTGGPARNNDALRQQVVALVNEIATLDALIADADIQIRMLPHLVTWMIRVRHSVLWLLCLPRDQVAAGLTWTIPPVVRDVPPAVADLTVARQRTGMLLLVAVVVLLVGMALVVVVLLGGR